MKRNYKVLAAMLLLFIICLSADFFILDRAGFFWAILFSLVTAGPGSFLYMIVFYTIHKKPLPTDIVDLMKEKLYGKVLNYFCTFLLSLMALIKLYTWVTQ